MGTRNLETIRRLFEAVAARDPDVLLSCYHEDVTMSVYRMREGCIAESAMHHFDTARLLAFLKGT